MRLTFLSTQRSVLLPWYEQGRERGGRRQRAATPEERGPAAGDRAQGGLQGEAAHQAN